MGTWIKRTAFLMASTLLVAAPVFAQSEPESAGPATFVGSYTLWAAIVIGFLATAATIYYAVQLQGGVVARTLFWFGAGMFFVVAGFLSVVVGWADASVQGIVHDFLFIIGYGLMLIGAARLRQLSL